MKIIQQYNLGDVTFVVTELESKAQVIVGKKTYEVAVVDLKAFAAAVLGRQDSAHNTPTEHALPGAKVSYSDLDNRKAVSSAPMKVLTMEDMRKIEKPVNAPPSVFGGLGPMTNATVDGIAFGLPKK